jgi:hypothetical protein
MSLVKEIFLLETSEKFVQIFDLPLNVFVEKFKKIASEPKVQSVIRAGLTDGLPSDEITRFSSKNISAEELIPTQSEIGVEESMVSILNNNYGNLDSILDGVAKFNSPIVTLNGKYIIDGHHRWSQAYLANPEVKIPSYDMKSTIEPLQALKAVHIAIAADTKELPLSSAKGINLYQMKRQDVLKYVKNFLTESSLRLYSEHGHGKKPIEVAEYLWKNVQSMQKNNRPISGAPKRTSMPQTGDSKNYDDLLKRGIINFKTPKTADVKTEGIIKLKDLIK